MHTSATSTFIPNFSAHNDDKIPNLVFGVMGIAIAIAALIVAYLQFRRMQQAGLGPPQSIELGEGSG
jgi:hypothetical protein